MLKTSTLILLLLITIRLTAQDSIKTTPVAKKMFLHTLVGVQIPGNESFNNMLKDAGFGQMSPAYFSRGASFYSVFPKSRLVSFLNYQTYAGTRKRMGTETAARGTVIGSALGYNLVNHNKNHLIPFAGLQYSWFGTRLSRSESAEQPIEDYLGGEPNQYHLACNGFMANFGVHAAFLPFKGKGAISNTLIGLRAGYYLPLESNNWKTNTTTITGGPKINTQGLFAGFVIGVGL